MLGDAPQVTPERPDPQGDGSKLLFYPPAERVLDVSMTARGQYPDGYPEGAVVHFTAGRSLKGESDAMNTVKNGDENGFMFFVISRGGTVYQNFTLNNWGYHAGQSSYPGLGVGVSSKLVGIEICNAGKLTKKENGTYVSWFGEIYPESEVRWVKADGPRQEGYYHKFTEDQEEALIALLVWLKKNNPEKFQVKYIVGHEDVSPGRKQDPGGALSMTINELRKQVEKLTTA
jgi:N-acetyl-anhydromuramyl-L-alanine amidase AmpD